MGSELDGFFSALSGEGTPHELLDPSFQYLGGNPSAVRSFFLGSPPKELVISYLLYVLAALLFETKVAKEGAPRSSKSGNFQAAAKALMSHAKGALEKLKKAGIAGFAHNSALSAFPELTIMLVRYAPDRPVTALLQLAVNPAVREGLKKRVEALIGSSSQSAEASKVAMGRQEKDPITKFLGGPESQKTIMKLYDRGYLV